MTRSSGGPDGPAARGGGEGSPQERLTSWKQIARYLGRDVRTVMRWEKEAGLPVHRVGGRSGGSVFAYREEVDAWLRGGVPAADEPSPATARPDPKRMIGLVAVGSALLTIGLVLATAARRGGGTDATALDMPVLVSTGELLVGTDAHGVPRWEYRHPSGATWETHPQVVTRISEDADGAGLLVAVNAFRRDLGAVYEGRLLRFSATGDLLWSVTPDASFDFEGWRFGPPWVSHVAASTLVDGAPATLWAVHHHTWWPSFVSVVRPGGATTIRYVNAGWITAVTALQQEGGTLLLAGGISNAHGAAMLAVLPATQGPAVASPEEPGSGFSCSDCPAGRPIGYFLFPPSDLSAASGQPYNQVAQIQVVEEGIRVVVREGDLAATSVRIYLLSRDLELIRSDLSDSFWVDHRKLRAEGKLDHDEAACPERLGPRTIRAWTPEGGWHERTFATPLMPS